jgi:hypothetical protein
LVVWLSLRPNQHGELATNGGLHFEIGGALV